MSDVSGFFKTLLFGGRVGGAVGCSKKTEPKESKKPAPQSKAQISPKASTKPNPTPTSNALITWTPTLIQEMNSHDSAKWQKANWSNGFPFNNTWQPDNVTFRDGKMVLTLDNKGCPSSCDSKPYASGEYRTLDETYNYGYYEARMKAVTGKGLVSSFFVYTGKWGEPSHQEIDFEILGRNCSAVQLNHYSDGNEKGTIHNERIVNLSFNACKEFHNYGFRWAKDSIIWYIDGKEVHRATEDPNTPRQEIPKGNTKIMVNFWPGVTDKKIVDWLGLFKYSGKPLGAQYDWIKFSPLDKGQPPAQTAPAPSTPAVKGSGAVGILRVEDIQQSSFSFNGGNLSESKGIYSFSADHARDPGFGILTGNRDLAGRKLLKFEIKGSTAKHGGYARFIAQIYSDKDNDYTPSVSLDPVAVGKSWSEAVVDLRGKIGQAKKVQFLLVTDKGSCKVEIKNIRFE